MKALEIRIAAVIAATAFFVAGCSPPVRYEAPRAALAVASAPSLPVERVTRYYVDETGAIWDDRGKKYD